MSMNSTEWSVNSAKEDKEESKKMSDRSDLEGSNKQSDTEEMSVSEHEDVDRKDETCSDEENFCLPSEPKKRKVLFYVKSQYEIARDNRIKDLKEALKASGVMEDLQELKGGGLIGMKSSLPKRKRKEDIDEEPVLLRKSERKRRSTTEGTFVAGTQNGDKSKKSKTNIEGKHERN